MDEEDARERIEELQQELRRHNHLYYVENDPEISDARYDELLQQLRELEEQYPEYRTDDSPTRRVGAPPLDAFEKVEHAAPMLSLDSSTERERLERFVDRARSASDDCQFVIEPKFDGLSVEFVYEEGELTRAATRGDGTVGEGILENVRTIRTVPLRLRDDERGAPTFLSVRGEVLMPVQGFAELNERLLDEGESGFANPRNAAAGSLRQLDSSVTAGRPLEVYFYDILDIDGENAPASQLEALDALRDWGMRVNEETATASSADDIVDYHHRLGDRRDSLEFEIDGVVVKVDDFGTRRELGATSRHPRWAFALKFEPRREQTRVIDIIASVGRTGIVTPVAMLRPVEIGGVTVARATLHNREEVARKDVRVRDRVRVQRAGDVIPQVVEVLDPDRDDREDPYEMPTGCPSCGTKLVEHGPYTVCPNGLDCPAQLAGRVQHLASRDALDIEGLGEETARLLVSEELVQSVPDLFELTVEDLESLDGFAGKSATNLVDQLESSSPADLHRLLYGLGIPEVGTTVAGDLARHFGTLDAVRSASEDQLTEVIGVGDVMAEQIAGFFADEHNATMIDRLLEHLEVKAPEETGTDALDGLTIVFTGSLDRFTRDEAQALVERHGARATSSVSGNTDLLVAGDNAGSKLDRARDLGVKILDEETFLDWLAEQGLSDEE